VAETVTTCYKSAALACPIFLSRGSLPRRATPPHHLLLRSLEPKEPTKASGSFYKTGTLEAAQAWEEY